MSSSKHLDMKAIHLSPPYTKYLLGVAWALVIAFLFVLAVDSFISNCGGDACLFIYVAEGILQGEIPYLDRWDNKGPLLYLLHAIGLMTNEEWGIWAIQGLFLLGTVWFAFTLLRKLFGLLPALFALAVFSRLFEQVCAARKLYRAIRPSLPASHPLSLHSRRRRLQTRAHPTSIHFAALRHRRPRCCFLPA